MPLRLSIKKLLVSQFKPTSEKSPYFDIAEKYGVDIDFRPFIKIEPLTTKEFRQQRVAILDYSAVIFTARTAIDHFFRLCKEMRITVPETMKYFCMTETIAVYLQKYIIYRKRKVFYGQSGKMGDLITLIGKHSKEKYLLPVFDIHKENLTTVLNTPGGVTQWRPARPRPASWRRLGISGVSGGRAGIRPSGIKEFLEKI